MPDAGAPTRNTRDRATRKAVFDPIRQAAVTSNQESVRDAGTCLGGFLGLFLGAMLGFAFCMKYIVDKVARDDGSVHSNQALAPCFGVMAGASIGAIGGALAIRFAFATYAMVFRPPHGKT